MFTETEDWIRFIQLKQKIEDFANADVLSQAEEDFFRRTQEYIDNIWIKEAM